MTSTLSEAARAMRLNRPERRVTCSRCKKNSFMTKASNRKYCDACKPDAYADLHKKAQTKYLKSRAKKKASKL